MHVMHRLVARNCAFPPVAMAGLLCADTVPNSGGGIEDPTPLRRPHLVFCHVIAGAWNVRLTILFDQDGVAGEPPPLLSNTPFLRVCLGYAAIRRAGAPHADDVVASLAAHFFHVTKCHIRECAARLDGKAAGFADVGSRASLHAPRL
jgi:hypothetical protein